jgi:hypothetical protein
MKYLAPFLAIGLLSCLVLRCEAQIGPFSGRVLDNEGKPAAAASIYWVQGYAGSARLVGATHTDSSGSFVFQTRPPRQVLEQEHLVIEAAGAGATVVEPYELRFRQDIFLAMPTTLRIRIVGETGKPIAGARVGAAAIAVGPTQADLPDRLISDFSAASDAHGVAVIHGLPQGGTALLTSSDRRYAFLVPETTELSNVSISETKTRRLLDAASIRGKVLDASPGGR